MHNNEQNVVPQLAINRFAAVLASGLTEDKPPQDPYEAIRWHLERAIEHMKEIQRRDDNISRILGRTLRPHAPAPVLRDRPRPASLVHLSHSAKSPVVAAPAVVPVVSRAVRSRWVPRVRVTVMTSFAEQLITNDLAN